MAGSSTLNRLELSNNRNSRCHKLPRDPARIEACLLRMGVRCLPKHAVEVVLDSRDHRAQVPPVGGATPPSRPISRGQGGSRPGGSRERHRYFAVVPLIPDQRYYGEATVGPARAKGAVSEGRAGGLRIVIWPPHHKCFSASHWRPGTFAADDSRCPDCAKSLLGVQIRIPGSDMMCLP